MFPMEVYGRRRIRFNALGERGGSKERDSHRPEIRELDAFIRPFKPRPGEGGGRGAEMIQAVRFRMFQESWFWCCWMNFSKTYGTDYPY